MIEPPPKRVTKIAVFDSGLGSLSIIRAIRSVMKADIVYFADRHNFPYGLKSRSQLDSIITRTIHMLEERFSPDCILMASNTPSLMLEIHNPKVIGVRPPLAEACKVSRSGRIGILATRSAMKSRGLSRYIRQNILLPGQCRIHRIDGSRLVALVESGRFLTDTSACRTAIREVLEDVVSRNSIDTVTLSSTHLPFLQDMLYDEFPNVKFIDPGMMVAQALSRQHSNSARNSLRIFTSSDPEDLQNMLARLGIRNKVLPLSI